MSVTFSVLSTICFCLAAVLLVAAVYFGIRFDIYNTFCELTGRTAKKSIQRFREENEKKSAANLRNKMNVSNDKSTLPIKKQLGVVDRTAFTPAAASHNTYSLMNNPANANEAMNMAHRWLGNAAQSDSDSESTTKLDEAVSGIIGNSVGNNAGVSETVMLSNRSILGNQGSEATTLLQRNKKKNEFQYIDNEINVGTDEVIM